MESGVEKIKNLIQFLLSPTARYSVLAILVVGLIAGVGSVIAFNVTLSATSTEAFCTDSCHSLTDNPGMMLQASTHFAEKSGVRPTCSVKDGKRKPKP